MCTARAWRTPHRVGLCLTSKSMEGFWQRSSPGRRAVLCARESIRGSLKWAPPLVVVYQVLMQVRDDATDQADVRPAGRFQSRERSFDTPPMDTSLRTSRIIGVRVHKTFFGSSFRSSVRRRCARPSGVGECRKTHLMGGGRPSAYGRPATLHAAPRATCCGKS